MSDPDHMNAYHERNAALKHRLPVSVSPVSQENRMSSAFCKPATSKGGEDFELPPAGTYPAVLVALVDLGTHDNDYGDKGGTQHEGFLVWEVVADKRYFAGRSFTLTTGPKSNLRKLMESWRGRAYAEGEAIDVTKCLGQPCLCNITHGKSAKGNDFYKVDSVMRLPAGMPVPTASKPTLCWEIGQPMESIPAWIPFVIGKDVRTKIKESYEARGVTAPIKAETKPAEPLDEIPF